MKGVIIMTKQKFGLTGTALKTIALVLMVMDHIHYFFEFTGVVPEWFSMLARLSMFPTCFPLCQRLHQLQVHQCL